MSNNKRVSLFSIWILIMLLLAACQTSKRVVLHVDGQDRVIHTSATTVGELLGEAQITLGTWDRVEPSEWAELERNNVITIIRIREERETEELPFAKEVIRDEGLPEGQTRLLQAGRPGTAERVYRVSYDGLEELGRQFVSRRVLTEPRPEIMAVGVTPGQATVPITGIIAYLANGNAWIVRNDSAEKRPVTYGGDLDGRVFALSTDGQNLAFTRYLGHDGDGDGNALSPFNELWVQDTRILQEEPRTLAITNVLHAEWSPDGSQLAYSTAESAKDAPGWRARNDLWIIEPQGMTQTLILPPSAGGPFGWWGNQFVWAPTGDRIAYASPDTIGVIQMPSGRQTPLLRFPVFDTNSEWVWIPQLSWSPEGRFLICLVHGIASDGTPVEESPAFDLWILDTVGPVSMQIASHVGMWSNPTWSHEWVDAYGKRRVEIAFGVSQIDSLSQYGLYDLYVMDRDGSNRRRLLPQGGGPGLRALELAWSPSGSTLAVIWEGDLYLLNVETGELTPLTQGIECDRVAWGGRITDSPADISE